MIKTEGLLGILGGTFDPIHLGHLQLAAEIKNKLKLTEIRLLPCYQPVHRSSPITTPEQRLIMAKLAVQEYPGLIVDPREIERGGTSYMFDTLMSFRKDFRDRPIALIMAMDAFMGFHTWHQWQEIPELAHLIIANRDHDNLVIEPDLKTFIQQHKITDGSVLQTRPAGYVYFIHIKALPIAATTLRSQIAAGIEPLHSLPLSVWQYIKTNGLYKTK